MIFVGIDIGSQIHVAAAVDDHGVVVLKAQRVEENAEGHASLRATLQRLGAVACIVLEATGHYWKNLAAMLLPDVATEELRELVRHRDRLVQDFGDRVRQLRSLYLYPYVRAQGPSLRPDLPTGEPARAAAVKDGRRPPRSGAERVLDGREHAGTLAADRDGASHNQIASLGLVTDHR